MLNNSNYEAIYSKFEKRRYNAETENNVRFNEIIGSVEGFKQLSEKGADLSVKYAAYMLLGHSQHEQGIDIKKELAHLESQKAELLKKHGYPRDYLEVRYHCPLCKDTGYYLNKKCKCLQKAIIEFEYSQSNISRFVQENNFSALKTDLQSGQDLDRFLAAVGIAKKFCENFNKDNKEYKNLLFSGTVGTGKSFISGCIAKYLLDKGYCVVYFSAVRLFDALGDRLLKRQELSTDFLHDTDLLIIDDLGTEISNDFTNSRLFECINERFLSKKPIIISTNLSPSEIHARYTDRISSRLFSHFTMCKFTGKDVRRILNVFA